MKLTTMLLAGTAVLLAASAPALAQDGAAQAAQGQPTPDTDSDAYHAEETEEVVVTGIISRDVVRTISGTTVVTGEELDRERRPTIGETLARQPGVSATSFGPNASRPVLRGFQGERIRVLDDGIGSFDVSNTSVDHPVQINPLIADRVEILRGPSSLLFGSSAIGGVVNVLTSRIPRALPDEAVHLDAIATYGSAADERSVGGTVDVPVGGGFVLHADGRYSKRDDLEIGGFVLARPQREQALASGDAEIAELATLRGRIPNTQGRDWEVAGGAAYVGETGNFGLSLTRSDSLFGVPVRYALEPGGEAEEVALDVRQWRADVRGEVLLSGGFLERIRMRGGYADYRHDEIELEEGEVGTRFFSDSGEGRIEFVQRATDGHRGAFGVQGFGRDFRIEGAEKYLPRNTTRQFGVFTEQEFDIGMARLSVGARYENTRQRADADEDIGNDRIVRTFDAFSGSVGGSLGLNDNGNLRVGVNVSRSERAPSAEELFSNGPHAGTQAFEIGDPGFAKEKSWSVEGTLRGRGPGYSFAASAYYSWFDDFIFENPTDLIEDDLPVFQYRQGDARYYGFEVEANATLAQARGFRFVVDGVADYVRATVEGFGPAPRIPPLRLLGGLEAQSDRIDVRGEVERVFKQDRTAPNETRTNGFTLVNASVSFKPIAGNNQTSILLSANNIFDVNARRHASFLKDFAPLAGRDLRATLRIGF